MDDNLVVLASAQSLREGWPVHARSKLLAIDNVGDVVLVHLANVEQHKVLSLFVQSALHLARGNLPFLIELVVWWQTALVQVTSRRGAIGFCATRILHFALRLFS